MTLSRRTLIGAAGLGSVAVAGGLGLAQQVGADGPGSVDFHGNHQAGILTPVQDHLHFVALDVTTSKRSELIALLKEWTDAARRMTAGSAVGDENGAVGGAPLAPPADTGEALGLAPSRLTLTIGFGPGLFERFGLENQRPDALRELPAFSGDRLDAALCGGDIAIQACADDPQVAVHAVRNLVRIGFGRTSVRWSQLGFGRTSSTSKAQETPRNLLGFKDGTDNIKSEDRGDVDDFVWVPTTSDPAWLAGGSYLVTRKIAMRIEIWDRESLVGQEEIIGRRKGSGAPIGADGEFAPVELKRLDAKSHVRLAHPRSNAGAKILRRGYNYVDGSDGLGQLSAGLFFVSYQRDPAQFIRVQRSLAGTQNDRLNEYIVHIGSAVFACPPGVRQGGWWGETLFA